MKGEEVIDVDERVAMLVPKRNVETWALCLNDKSVDENTNYKDHKHPWTDLISAAAENLSKFTLQSDRFPTYCVDSLRLGIQELKGLRLKM